MGIAIIVPNVSFANNNIGKVTISSNGGGSNVIDVTAITISGPSTVNTDSNIATYSVAYTPSNTTQKGVKWSIESGSDYASITQNGTLTVKKTGSVTIKATSTYNSSIVATKTISVTYNIELPLKSITISGPQSVNNDNNTAAYSVAYTPSNTTQIGVKWSIFSGSEYATITQDGTLNVRKSGLVIIKATSTQNPSIEATYNVNVTYVEQAPTPAHEELLYIGTANGNYVDTNATMYASSKIFAKAKMEEIESPTNTMRQFIFHDNDKYLIGNLHNDNSFACTTPGHRLATKTIASGLVELEVSKYTHNISVNGEKVTDFKSNIDMENVDGGKIYLFASPAVLSKNNKRVDIYYFKQEVNGEVKLNLIPVLKDGKPCFFDSISGQYQSFTGSGKIFYATKSNPTNELIYNG